MEQTVALDSCVVIGLMEDPGLPRRLRAGFRGKSIRIVLCDVVLGEVRRVRGLSARAVIEKVSRLLGRPVQVSNLTAEQDRSARMVTEQYRGCHEGGQPDSVNLQGKRLRAGNL